jgi:hypothetical protein
MDHRRGLDGYSLTPKHAERLGTDASKLAYSRQLLRQLQEKEGMTNVPGSSAFDAAEETEQKS